MALTNAADWSNRRNIEDNGSRITGIARFRYM